jgi:hypothetical protein
VGATHRAHPRGRQRPRPTVPGGRQLS